VWFQRTPDPQALELIWREADDIVAVTDQEVANAMRILFTDTHNVAEGAGAAALAAAIQQKDRWQNKTVGVSLSGGNVDAALFTQVLSRAF
jgi:threonine dehydratase